MVKINGIYNKRFFINEQSGFQIFNVRVKDLELRDKFNKNNGCITCQGVIPPYICGISLDLYGEWDKDSYGDFLKISAVEESSEDADATIAYLSSGIIRGIGKVMASSIVNEFGPNIYKRCLEDGFAEQLSNKVGLSPKKAAEFVAEIRKTADCRMLYEYLSGHGCLNYMSVKNLISDYGERAKKVLVEHPYELGQRYNLSFATCDSIAFENGGTVYNPDRINLMSKIVIEQENTSGNVFSYEKNLVEKIIGRLNSDTDVSVPAFFVETALSRNRILYVEEDEINRIYTKALKAAEVNTAKQVRRLLDDSIEFSFNDNCVKKAEEFCGIEYASEQKSAFNLLRKSGIGILTGGPGTGKTTVVKGIIHAYQTMYPMNKIKLCAPTGRAAQRMSESTGMESTTIHRLLDYKPYGNDVSYKTADDPIDADFIIVDEASMLDLQLASILLSAVKSGALIIFVGDINQLQSVGAGDVLNDFINCGVIPVQQLKKVYRQAATSYIVKNALEINSGSSKLAQNDEFEIYNRNKGELTKTVVDYVKKIYDKDNPYDVQVLCPTHKGDGGVASVNFELQKVLNPYQEGSPQLRYGSTTFRINDKIIMLRNNIEVGYFNGDVGTVKNITDDGLVVTIQDKDLFIEKTLLDDIKLAYAMTIHKSQGSEFKTTIITLPSTLMLQRNLLYTGVTRAKKKAILVTEPGNIDVCVKRCNVGKRNTRLVERINGET